MADINQDNDIDPQPIYNGDDSLKTLEKGLYSRSEGGFSSVPDHEARFKKHDIEVKKGWGGEGIERNQNYTYQSPRMSFFKKFFFISLVFFLSSVGVATYIFFGGGNVVSSNKVDISVTGPVSIAGGEVLPLEIKVSNQNNADMETADLIIDYPDGTRQAEDTSVVLKRYREALGVIPKGGDVVKKIQAVLFGQEGDIKDLNISVEYRVKGSNATFPKEKKYSVAISSAPVTLVVSSVKEVNSNQDAEFTITVTSNAPAVIQKLALSAEYPFGFTFKSSNPDPSWSNSFWQLGDIKPGVKRTIKILGTITGQNDEDRTFRFSAGTESPSDENVIGTQFLTAFQKISIKKPFIEATLALNGDRSDIFVAKSGKNVRADLVVANNIGVKMTDVKVSVKFGGNIIDLGSVNSSAGFFRSSDKTIVWDQTLDNKLAVLNPDDSVPLTFSFSAISEEEMRSIKNPGMTLEVEVKGLRLNEAGISQEVTSKITKVVRVPSALGLSTRALYYSGPFTNTGPIPPQVDKDTSYTIVWSLTNGSNDLSNVVVTATLPSYVKWLAVSQPNSEEISYAPVGGKITWNVGDLKAGTGFSSSPREVSFQVSLTPGVGQIRTLPTLVTPAEASGQDNFVGQTVVTGSKGPLTTDLPTDVSSKPEQGRVIP